MNVLLFEMPIEVKREKIGLFSTFNTKRSKIYVIRGHRNVVTLNLRFTRATSKCFVKNNSVKIENNDHGRE